MNIYKLSDFPVGQVGVVTMVNIHNEKTKRHLLDMGMTKGAKVQVVKKAPLGDPIEIGLRGYKICIAKKILKNILLEVDSHDGSSCWKSK